MTVPAKDTVIIRTANGAIQTYTTTWLQKPSEPTLTLLYSKYCLEQKRWIIACVDKATMTFHRLIFEDGTYKKSHHCSCESCKLISYRNGLGMQAHNRNHQANLLDSEGQPLIVLKCLIQNGFNDVVVAVNSKGEVYDYIFHNGAYHKGKARLKPQLLNIEVLTLQDPVNQKGPLKLTPVYIATCEHLNQHLFYATTQGSTDVDQYVFNTVELGFERIRCEPCELLKRFDDLETFPKSEDWCVDVNRAGRCYVIKQDSEGFLQWEWCPKDVKETPRSSSEEPKSYAPLNPYFPYYYGHPPGFDPSAELAKWAQVAEQVQEGQRRTNQLVEHLRQVMEQMKVQQEEMQQLRLLEAEARGIGSSLFSGLTGAGANESRAPQKATPLPSRIQNLDDLLAHYLPTRVATVAPAHQKIHFPSTEEPPKVFSRALPEIQRQYVKYLQEFGKASDVIKSFDVRAPEASEDSESLHDNWVNDLVGSDDEQSGYESPV